MFALHLLSEVLIMRGSNQLAVGGAHRDVRPYSSYQLSIIRVAWLSIGLGFPAGSMALNC